MKNRYKAIVSVMTLLALLLGFSIPFVTIPTQAADIDRLLITEIVPAPKAKGEAFEYIELYNPTDSAIDLTGFKIYYYENMKSPEPWTSDVIKWNLVANDELSGGRTDMFIPSKSTKVVWLIPKGYKGSIQDFNKEYGSTLTLDQFVYIQLEEGQGLINDEQRYVAVVGPDGDQVKDRISMVAYNVQAGAGKCKYEPRPGEKACDFIRKEDQLAESVTYYYPANGLDPITKLMDYKLPYSIHQKPTPGKIVPARQAAASDLLLITEIVPAPKTDGEHFEYIELYNPGESEVDLTGHKIYYYDYTSSKEPWTSTVTKWDMVAMDTIIGNKTDMKMKPHSVKIVWLIKPGFNGKLQDFNKEYGTDLEPNRFVFVKLGAGQGLSNDQQRFVAVVGPEGDQEKDRISMVTYNEEAGSAKCKYVAKENEHACDFTRKANQSSESVNYYYPSAGLDPATKMMERRIPDSLHQIPTPGTVMPEQLSVQTSDAAQPTPETQAASDILITEIVPAPKTDGEQFEYVELYNPTDHAVDLTGYKIYYYEDTNSIEPWTSKVIPWDIVGMDSIAGGKTSMIIQPRSTKVVWLIKKGFSGNVQDFNKEYGTHLNSDQFVFVALGAGQGLSNDQQRFVAIVGPGGDKVKDRISMITYNEAAGNAKCKYAAKENERACDFVRKANQSTESVNYYYPAAGLSPVTKMMERRELDSVHQKPTPGTILPMQVEAYGHEGEAQESQAAIGSLLITELVPAPKTEAELFEYIELYNHSDKPIDLTGYKIYYYKDMKSNEPWTSQVTKWSIVPSDKISGGKTDMVIRPGSTKVVWLLKKAYGEVFSTQDFNDEYGTNLTSDQFVYVKLGESEGLDNDVQRYVSIVAPRGNQVSDRISMATYNVASGSGKCKYAPKEGEIGCDYVRKGDELAESVIYFYPANGLDPISKIMEHRGPLSAHHKPTPGSLLPEQLLNLTGKEEGSEMSLERGEYSADETE
ncbi:lamin tail domain-containing protein [Paenibacillus sp. UNC451MF]|uniref:lamin tail domain-containing protein n=1 Tax=Paenibacillus sp. UNC451MF TaxID=1449063 RepID=UPI0004917190|nr:lamin tail domain-containing protein [Paenibacillus sp. UNC451MF]